MCAASGSFTEYAWSDLGWPTAITARDSDDSDDSDDSIVQQTSLWVERSELALPNGNTMQHLAQFKILQGLELLSGRVGPNFGHPGGGIQYVVPDKDILERIE